MFKVIKKWLDQIFAEEESIILLLLIVASLVLLMTMGGCWLRLLPVLFWLF